MCGDQFVCGVCGGWWWCGVEGVVDDLTITGNFPTACTQRRPSEGKKDEKEKKFNTVCKKGGKVQKSSELMKKREGSYLPLFSDSQIFSIDRSPTPAQKGLSAYWSNLQFGSLLSHLPPFCTPGWSTASTSRCTFCQPTSTWPCRCCCRTTSHSLHCLLQVLFGNPKAGFRSGIPHRVPSQPLIPGLLSIYLS